jgi:hypothetical protein
VLQGRDAKRLEPFTQKGAAAFVAAATNAGALTKAFLTLEPVETIPSAKEKNAHFPF